MSEEEKQAIERLTFYRDQIKEELYPRIDYEEEKAIGIVLNLLEKQQKEIEELKEKNKNLIFQLKDEEKELIEVTQNIISKDKIMAKIEELEKKAKEMKYDYDVSYAEEDLFNKNVKFFKEQMQELLEEPKLLEEN